MAEIINCAGLHKSYNTGKSQLNVIRGIDLAVAAGSSVFIIGPSGAGKSTLLHLLGGLDEPDKGKVFIDGVNIASLSDRRRAHLRKRVIGFVFQFYHLLPEFSAIENVMLPALMNTAGDRKAARSRAEGLLGRLGLTGRLKHMPDELSGGERQRVAIARAMINRPGILFCDEPTGNLDSHNSEEIFELLLQLRREEGLTILVVTHQADYAGYADLVLNMKDGLILR